MKILASSYTFNKTAKTVTFAGNIPSSLDKIQAIVNTTANVVIYNPTRTMLGGTYTSPTLTLTYNTSAMSDTDKLLIYLDGTPASYDSAAYEASAVAKASSGRLLGISGYNSGPAQWIQVHNTSSLPSDGATPILIFKIPAEDNFYFDTTGLGKSFSTGITVCNSTTGPTKTIGASNCWFNILFV